MQKKVFFSPRRIYDRIKLLGIELIIVLISFFISFFGMVYIIRRIFLHEKTELDDNAFRFMGTLVSDSMTSVMNFFTFFGGQYFLVPVNILLIIWAFFIKRDKWFGIRVASVAFSSLILMFALKMFFARPRPLTPLLKEARGLSFPSGHAFMSFVFFGLMIYIVNEKLKGHPLKIPLIILLLCFTIMVGLSRIYLRVHYASDVIAGLAMGLMWLVISMWVIHMIEKHKSKLPVSPTPQ